MKNCWRFAISTLIVLICLVTTVEAETRYISDQLVVSLREQPQKGAQSITYLKTDTAVEILEEDGEYIKVQTKAGEIGYIKQNYLTTKTPSSVIIKQLQRERDRLAAKAGEMQQQVTAATSKSSQSQQELATQLKASKAQVSELQKGLQETQTVLTQTTQAYQTLQKNAKEVVEITKERDQLRKANQELIAAVTELEDEVEGLAMTGIIKWFLAGAGVLFFGWIIGKSSGGRRSRF